MRVISSILNDLLTLDEKKIVLQMRHCERNFFQFIDSILIEMQN